LENFRLAVTYLQFHIHVCFQPRLALSAVAELMYTEINQLLGTCDNMQDKYVGPPYWRQKCTLAA